MSVLNKNRPVREWFSYRDAVVRNNVKRELEIATRGMDINEALNVCRDEVDGHKQINRILISRVRHLENKIRKKKKCMNSYRNAMKILKKFDSKFYAQFKAMMLAV